MDFLFDVDVVIGIHFQRFGFAGIDILKNHAIAGFSFPELGDDFSFGRNPLFFVRDLRPATLSQDLLKRSPLNTFFKKCSLFSCKS